jgi:outer membrane protein assembly factor BamD (BamD/ComL family)
MKKVVVVVIMMLTIFLNFQCKNQVKNKAYYFQQANRYVAQRQYKKAVEYFEKVINDFDGPAFRARSIFMLGYLYANELKDQPGALEKARTYYNRFLKEFPEHELAKSVEMELKNLGKDPNEIILQQVEKSVEQKVEK